MARRGRPPLKAAHAQRVDGSQQARDRLEWILKTLNGELPVAEACERLGVGEAQFYRLRERALAGAVEALEPRPAGRPPSIEEPTDARVRELEQRLKDTELELRASQVREELAMVMPHVVQPPEPPGSDKKKRRRPRKRRRGFWGKKR